ncbi:DUF924 family protein [Arenibaculum pallidiluteum]|uniref:DUF924 family protein n=1 Tax=Arenibaculum pallidiluteum TaxID=2812559 RepID=UPI001A96AA01|nr:DUF924 family protein [Arenibaculum pallidiluteum]
MKPQQVLEFWFGERARTMWWEKSDRFDAEVRATLGAAHAEAAAGALDDWREAPEPCLALVILLDQVPRNIHRGTPRAFATDAQARAVTRIALDRRFDDGFDVDRRMFLYLPLEHSEDLADQELLVDLVRTRIGPGMYLDYAVRHRDIILRFGRFPHRNAILGRASTEDEVEFLKQPGSSF